MARSRQFFFGRGGLCVKLWPYYALVMNLCSRRLDVVMFRSKNKNWDEYMQYVNKVRFHDFSM